MTVARIKFINDNIALATAVCQGTGIYPEVLLTQAIVESQKDINGVYTPGESQLSKKYFNFFGIKSSAGWKGKTVSYLSREYVNDYKIGVFRAYNSKNDGFKDYVNFLKSNPRYTAAGVFTAKTPAEQLKAIAAGGWATDPTYSAVLQNVAAGVIAETKKKVTPKPPALV